MNAHAIGIRSMAAGDISVIAEMERTIFPDPWPTSSFRDALNDPHGLNLVALPQDGTAICAYLCAQIVVDEVHIHNVAVVPSYRRQGIGRELLEHAELEGRKQGADCCILEVRIDNSPALTMYGRLGYRRIGRRRRYYRNPVCDALVLLKILDESPRGQLTSSGRTDGVVSQG